ncbi:MAG: hypothetical protein WKG00_05445 [Polyangiaceae bacterium]
MIAGCVASAFLACGSDAENVPIGSSSSSGGVGAAGSSSSSSSSSSSTSGPSSSSSSSSASSSGNGGSGGVGTPCEEACEKISDECGFGDLCSQVPQLDCGSAAGADCYGQCILDSDCGAIASLATNNPDPALSACLFACQGGQGGAGGGGQGGAGGGGGAAPGSECLSCGQSSCTSEGFACFQDAMCSTWLDCISNCTDAACVMACDQNSPGGPASDAVKDCLCTSCTADCSALITCN